jgi:hypothetical protein
MAERVGRVERGLDWLLHIIVLVLYPGLGLILPLALGLSTYWLVLCNVVGTVWAGVIVLGYSEVLWDSIHRRHLVDWSTDLRRLDSTEFEWLVGEVFRREGWNVRETGSVGRPDGNIDLEVTRGGNRAIVHASAGSPGPLGLRMYEGFSEP